MKGKLIVIEGIDVTRKSTMANLLTHRIKESTDKVYQMGFPSRGPIGTILHTMNNHKYYFTEEYRNPSLLTLLFTGDRYDRIVDPSDGILKHINDGDHVIVDGYYLSEIAYASYIDYGERDKYLETMKFATEQEKMCRDMIKPDATIFLYSDPGATIKESARGTHMRPSEIDALIEKTENLRKTYMDAINTLQRVYGDEISMIDDNGNGNLEVLDRIWKIVSPLFEQS